MNFAVPCIEGDVEQCAINPHQPNKVWSMEVAANDTPYIFGDGIYNEAFLAC